MYFNTWNPSTPGYTPTGWTYLDLTYGDRNWLLLVFPAPNHKNNSKHLDILVYITHE
jgi:hypothetical protein